MQPPEVPTSSHPETRSGGSRDAKFTVKSGLISKAEALLHSRTRLALSIVLAGGFLWRLWLAQATFFNADEAWHFFLANQNSMWLAYKASLTISHPPLLIVILHFWRALGTSSLVLRLPAVIAGTVFVWIFYKWLQIVAGKAVAWAGLILAAFLGPMITASAEVRQMPLLLLFAMASAWLLEVALLEDSALAMWMSCACICLALLSHYSAFIVAAAFGVYGIIRMLQQRPSAAVVLTWISGETVGVLVAGLLYKTHLGKLGILLSQPLLLPQQYLYSSYFHKGTDHLASFLYRGTFGVFRFAFGQTQIGQLMAILFAVGVVLIVLRRTPVRANGIAFGVLLILPFGFSWIAASAGLYPYGRMRQCMFLAIFVLAGVSVCLGKSAKENTAAAALSALAIVVGCHAFGTLQDRDALPVAEQRHEHMDQMLEFMRNNVGPNDLIFTDQATSFQLRHYLCRQKPVNIETFSDGLQRFNCEGFRVVFTGPSDGALTAQSVEARWHNSDGRLDLSPVAVNLWVVQGGWASGLGEDLRRLPRLSNIDVHSFGRFLEVFKLPNQVPRFTQG